VLEEVKVSQRAVALFLALALVVENDLGGIAWEFRDLRDFSMVQLRVQAYVILLEATAAVGHGKLQKVDGLAHNKAVQ
jgi:hypothetical protein